MGWYKVRFCLEAEHALLAIPFDPQRIFVGPSPISRRPAVFFVDQYNACREVEKLKAQWCRW